MVSSRVPIRCKIPKTELTFLPQLRMDTRLQRLWYWAVPVVFSGMERAGYSFDPINLLLEDRIFTHTGPGVFGVCADAGPDA